MASGLRDLGRADAPAFSVQALLSLAALVIGPYRTFHLEPGRMELFWLDQCLRLDGHLQEASPEVSEMFIYLKAYRGALRNLLQHGHGTDHYYHWQDHVGVTKRELAAALERALIANAGDIVLGLERLEVLDKSTRVERPAKAEAA